MRDGGLGGSVGMERAGGYPRDGGDCHDGARSAYRHPAAETLATGEGAPLVDGGDAIPFGPRNLLRRIHALQNIGTGHEYCRRSARFQACGTGFDCFGVRHVEANEFRADPRRDIRTVPAKIKDRDGRTVPPEKLSVARPIPLAPPVMTA